jgi:secondary thiamine-phosphate synthase enzyme
MIKIKYLEFETKFPKIHFFDITDKIEEAISESSIKNGTVTVQSLHTTCAVFFEEYVHDEDPVGHDYLQIDLNQGLRKIFPDQVEFNDNYFYPGPKHLYREGRPHVEFQGISLNGPAHLKSTLIGASETFVIDEGVLQTGPYGSIWFVDFDYNRPRKRKCVLCINGE